MVQLYEQYRPSCWGDVVGQPQAIYKIQTLKRRGLEGRAYWISGKSGTGKTTIARLIADEVADRFSIYERDATGYTPAAVEDDARRVRCRSLCAPHGQAMIINEAHGLAKNTIRSLLTTLEAEEIPEHVVWVFTTTCDGQQSLFDGQIDAHPLLSRCQLLNLQHNVHDAFAHRAKEIAEAEGLGGAALTDFRLLAKRTNGNMRAMLQAVESGDMAKSALSLLG